MWPDQSYYEGSFKNGKKHGQGQYYTPVGGQTYAGQFVEDVMDGEGRFSFADGRVYVGKLKDGHFHGQGKMAWENGSSYAGQYLQDKKHGEGIFIFTDGRKYIGQWEKGKQHGVGSIILQDGKTEKYKWNMGTKSTALETDQEEFVVTFARRAGQRLGMDVEPQAAGGTKVWLIKAVVDGLAREWNKKNPDKELMSGDCIISVNGVKDGDEMLQEMKQANDCTLVISRRKPS